MKRRTLLTILTATAFAPPARTASPDWQASLIAGGFDGQNYLSGLRIILAPGWKTYWRVPGEAGVPPDIKVSGDNLDSFEVQLPLPKRIIDESGEAIGYHDEVIFLLVLKPKSADQPVSAHVSAFFGVCQDICKPAKFDATLDLKPGLNEADPLLAAWRARLPAPSAFITSARQTGAELVLSLKQQVDDIFVEGPDGLYFRKPAFSQGKAIIRIDGLQDGQKLGGTSLRVTADMQGKGLEQVVKVA
jgi:DsbC/DsbD-like thiol-disulfide interchange protein